MKDDEIPPLEFNGHILCDNTSKANCLNDYFESQSTVSNENDPLPDTWHYNSRLEQIILTEEEVRLAISNLDTRKAVGPDKIHNILLTKSISVITNPLTTLFNKSLTEGIFPSIWKTAYVTPIHKKGSKANCSNYRPVSLLSCVGKLLEKCIQKHIVNYLMTNNIITDSQSGFTQGDSTIYQLLGIYDDFCGALDKNIRTQAIFFDISKAFDKVWHRGLLHKLLI